MKKALLILSAAAAFCTAKAQTTGTLPPAQQTAIETAILGEMRVSATPGAALAVIGNNRVMYEKWFGRANTLTNQSLNDSTLFQIGSVTKIFTALALLTELKKAGIDVHAPIGDVIKGLSPGLSKLSYHQLLSHTGGLADYWPSPAEGNLGVLAYFQDKGDRLFFARPGEVFSYCNTGFALAGLALEKLSGKPYPDAIGEIILQPLKLNNTTFDFLSVACKSFSAGHMVDPASGKVVPWILNVSSPLVQAAGGLYTNIRDLERFALCLMNNGEMEGVQLFDRNTVGMLSGRYAAGFTMTKSPYSFLCFPDNAYGYGMFSFDYGKSHLKGNIGIASQMTWLMMEPDKKTAIILLSNLQGDMLVGSIRKICEAVLGEKEVPAAIIELDQAESRAITGTYLLHAPDEPNDAGAEVLEKNGRLFFRVPGDEERELSRTGTLEYRFMTPASRLPGEILFERNASGTVRYMRFNWSAWEKVK